MRGRAERLWLILALIGAGSAAPAAGASPPGPPRDPGPPYRIEGRGFVTDGTHPRRPGDAPRYDLMVMLVVDPALDEISLEFGDPKDPSDKPTRFFSRHGRLFQVADSTGLEADPRSYGDLKAAAIAALHPALLAAALRDRPENLRVLPGGARVFAWMDELWAIEAEPARHRVASLTRAIYSAVHGDGTERVRYEPVGETAGAEARGAVRVTVTARGRETARFDFAAAVPLTEDSLPPFPAGDRGRDRSWRLAPREIRFTELAPHVFALDLDSLFVRVLVAEFADHVFVLEGTYGTHMSDEIARAVRERFGKPPRYFAFSHIHGQYIGGTRSWVAEGATIVVPPTTVPLVEEIVAAKFDSRPDALARRPRPLKVETVADRRTFEDATNALTIFEVESDHTDEYFIFWFPRARILVTGDLYFYRPGRPATGRAKKLCAAVTALGLDVERFVVSWPLSGYGTKNIFSRAEFDTACAGSP